MGFIPWSWLAVLAVLAFAPADAAAAPLADTPVSVTVTLDRPIVRLGDQVTLRIAVTHPLATRIQFPPAAALQLAGLEVLRVQQGQGSRSSDERVTTVMEYTVVGFSPQTFTFPPSVLQIAFEEPGGQQGLVMPAEPVTLTVESMLGELSQPTLRGIRPPVATAMPLVFLARPVAAASLAGAAALLFVLALRRTLALIRSRPAREARRTPQEQFRAALEAAAGLLGSPDPDYRRFYAELATAVRVYLAERTGLATLTATTRELRGGMEARGVDRRHAQTVLGLLDDCDLVKWAHRVPERSDAQRALTRAFAVMDLGTASAGASRSSGAGAKV